jgi:diaminopimelate decarboxylase/aspartate kinase
MATSPAWIVCKFGGTSVSTRDRWDTIARIAQTHHDAGRRPFLVCSAVSGISDQLEALLEAAQNGDPAPVLDRIRARHEALARQLNVDVARLDEGFAALEGFVETATQASTIEPRLRAEVMAMGELLSTRLGAAFLNAMGLSTRWLDARELLKAQDESHVAPKRRYLSATCAHYPDAIAQAHLDGRVGEGTEVFITQGFIASNAIGETVLLGRGGSDTSAAYFAAKLEAEGLEIWTDVPGMFTANPRAIPSARLLRQLGYEEAQELATMGAKVLHPRCIDPVRRYDIPLRIRSTEAPDLESTTITDEVPDYGPQVKAISTKEGITVISMDTLGMWQQVGFLADVFAVFKHNGLSVDLVATSETNVTVTLDPVANALDPETIERVLRDLNSFCDARQIGPCAVVSLVGRHIRSLLGEVGPSFEVFEEQQVHLVTQAASDLNFSFVVDEEQADRLARQLHAQLFGSRTEDQLFGPSWSALTHPADGAAADGTPWWHARREDLLSLADEATPRYVYDAATIRTKATELRDTAAIDRPFYAMKANSHPDVLRVIRDEGFSFECVSPGEVERIRSLFPDLDPDRILFQPNFAAAEEYADAFAAGIHVTLDNLHPLLHHPDIFAGEAFFVRVDPGRGHGHHRHVRTAGSQSKFGVVPGELDRLYAKADEVGARIKGLHVHVGSGITDEATWSDIADFLASLADERSDVGILNVGGGLGVPERPNADPLDLAQVADRLAQFKADHPAYDLWIEPGRYLVAEAGVLLGRVTQTKAKGDRHFVGIDTGMNSLIRPALYGSYHEIVNLSRLDAPPALTADVVGPICETGDVLGHSRRLPKTEEGDVLLVAKTGAYGASMRMDYNLRPPAEEVVLRAAVGERGGV